MQPASVRWQEGGHLSEVGHDRIRAVKSGIVLMQPQGAKIAGEEGGAKPEFGRRMDVLVDIVTEIKYLVRQNASTVERVFHGFVKGEARFCRPELVREEAEGFRKPEGGEFGLEKSGKKKRRIELGVRDDPENEAALVEGCEQLPGPRHGPHRVGHAFVGNRQLLKVPVARMLQEFAPEIPDLDLGESGACPAGLLVLPGDQGVELPGQRGGLGWSRNAVTPEKRAES